MNAGALRFDVRIVRASRESAWRAIHRRNNSETTSTPLSRARSCACKRRFGAKKIIVEWRFSHFRRVDTRRRRERRMRAARRGIHGWNSGAPAAPRHDAIPRRI
ncbi:hypothetical protein [Burkholderia vietnamiensis]|uniref:hypothetical protein n=1 Tax=Burkholderia vietnamiensis TaxID=60552 RepID=UPI0012D86664|nr:hypothetical protein [Burkholderia vietnamiensis]HDR9024055.1 hypothetical protein [Burkholderia vietnamiensis]